MIVRDFRPITHRDDLASYLVERIQETGNKRRTWARISEDPFQAEIDQVSNETALARWRKGERITPEIPLKVDNTARSHASPHHRQGRLSACKTRVEEAQPRHHDQDHT